ncbi:hypothetical protein DDZ13_07450 [Coraliomargarita sinensis]|uniref:SMODS and SLOG-associating 2TM effector domain-containing protein n=1 Tax=Coraliomargarita sinensis TaxID=2174842 RepID=A0A317ZKL6_9BACT|nr:SLATT domain-containing protein [Coraliomargarita sinensis]PXA04359.1 hypothetical protein DDZ13_07450 [Coraliomargarita sinensis]
MNKEASTTESPIPNYVADNDWEKELNYKTWVTKAARFQANKRLLETHKLSSITISVLSCCLIIAASLPIYVGNASLPFPSYWMNFLITSIAVLVLVFTQIESSSHYNLEAHKFHTNALKIANIYNELRIAKHIEDDKERFEAIISLTRKYEAVLAECENHDPIDYAISKTKKSEYFTLTEKEKKEIFKEYDWKVRKKYHILIGAVTLFTLVLTAAVILSPVISEVMPDAN